MNEPNLYNRTQEFLRPTRDETEEDRGQFLRPRAADILQASMSGLDVYKNMVVQPFHCWSGSGKTAGIISTLCFVDEKSKLLSDITEKVSKNIALLTEQQNSFERAIRLAGRKLGPVSANDISPSLKKLNKQRKETIQTVGELRDLINQAFSDSELEQVCFDAACKLLGITKDDEESNPPASLLTNLNHTIDCLWNDALRWYRILKEKSKLITCSIQVLSRFTRALKGAVLHTIELKFNDPSPTRLFTILNFSSNGGPPRLAAPLINPEYLYQRQGVAALGALAYG
jgi:hypothetical protein